MKKISTAYLASMIAACSLAQQTHAADTATLEDVEVISSATRTEQPIDGVTATVLVIDRAQIEKSGAQTLKDIIANDASLIIQYGTFPSASSASKSSISIRGIGASGTLWLIDGRRMSGEVSNPYDMDRIPASIIERIEVVKGPMSALYGADAVGGVINIITKKPKNKLMASVSARYGSSEGNDRSSQSLSADFRAGSDQVRYSLYASVQSSNPYTETENTNTRIGPNRVPPSKFNALPNALDSYAVDVTYRDEADVKSLGGRIEADITDSVMAGIEFNWFEEEREGVFRANFHPTAVSPGPGQFVPAFDVPVISNDNNKRLDIAADMTVDVNPDLLWTMRFYNSSYEKRNDTYMLAYQDFGFPSELASASSGMNANVDTNTLESYINWSANDSHLLTLGGEVRDEKREATVFSQNNDLEERSVAYQALYVQDEWQLNESLRFTLAGRYDRYEQDAYTDAMGAKRDSNTDSEPTFRFGLVKNINSSFNTRINIAQAYRVPDIRELFIQKQTPAGLQLGAQAVNPSVGKLAHELSAETTNAFEIGFFGAVKNFDYQVTAFHNVIDNRIEQIGVDADGDQITDYFTSMNISEAETTGVEIDLRYPFNDKLKGQLYWTEMDSENKETGNPLEFNPERVIATSLEWQSTEKLSLRLKATYTGEQYYTENRVDKKSSPYTLINSTINYKLGSDDRIEVFGGVDNMFDETVDKRLGSNEGRFYFAGLRSHF